MNELNAVKITIKAPAKLNLLLDITPNIVDGRHRLASVFTVCTIFDILEFNIAASAPGRNTDAVANEPCISIITNYLGGIEPVDISLQDNIIYQALQALAAQTNRQLPQVAVKVAKRIPVCAGLGGGSSNAAAAIRALAQYWELKPLAPQCLAAANAVGSDVAFFLYGGCALMSGFGQLFVRRLPQPPMEFVLVKPEAGNSTAAVYRAFDEALSNELLGVDSGCDAQNTKPPIQSLSLTLDVACALPSRLALEALAAQMSNNLTCAAIAVMPELADLLADLGAQPGVLKAMVAGSGSTCFALCESKQAAEQAAANYRQRGYWAAACSTPAHCSKA